MFKIPVALSQLDIYQHTFCIIGQNCNNTCTLQVITKEWGDTYSVLVDRSLLCEVIIMQESWKKPNCIAGKCNYPLYLADFHFLSWKRASKPPHETVPCEVVYFLQCAAPCRLPNRCLLDLVGVDPTPAGCVDGWPTIGLFLPLSLPIEEERGEERLRSG